MAMQILPILLLGGGATYVYKKQKDKARKRSGAECPAENTVTLNDSVAAGQQAAAKYANSADPFQEAEYYIRTLLPETCNKKSVKSRVKMNLTYAGKTYNVDLSVADLYILGVISGIDRRVGMGKLNQDQGQKFMMKALEWYKDTTGKPFDPTALGLEEFAQALMMAMKESIEQGLKELQSPSGPCPDHVIVDLRDAERNQIGAQMKSMISSGEKSPFKIADAIFENLMPKQCRRNDYKTKVEFRHNGELFKMVNAASFYAAIVFDTLEEMVDQGVITEQTATQAVNDLKASYKQMTGEELPANLT